MSVRGYLALSAALWLLGSGCGMRSTLSNEDSRSAGTLADSDGDGDGQGGDGDGDGDDPDDDGPCGDGEPPCDPTNLGAATCASIGAGNGILACDPMTCTYDTSMCQAGPGPTDGVGGFPAPPPQPDPDPEEDSDEDSEESGPE